MKIMGLPEWMYWLSWFINILIFYVISIVFIILLLKIQWFSNRRKVFARANPIILFIFLFLFACATSVFAFMISIFFKKASNASAAAGLIWVFSYVPFLSIKTNYEGVHLGLKIFSCISSNTALGFGMKQLVAFEAHENGLQWDNIWGRSSPDDSFVFGYVLVMLLVDCVIYIVLAICLENFFVGNRVKEHVLHILYKIRKKIKAPWKKETTTTSTVQNKDSNEPFPQSGIVVKKLTKVFAGKEVVKNVSMTVYQDQITVLLGHNGAGKTTLLSMLTGSLSPTDGTATIGSRDILKEKHRQNLGFCPQFDILLDELTVSEHLYLFCKIKGMVDAKLITEEIDKYVDMLSLQPKKNARALTLSGGMKRKLCVGIALCANSKFVIFDEPSAGMDPKAKRGLWDVLQSQKDGRTLILTTHSMDEADIVGDRIGIMLDGKLECIDTSFALKKKYGLGYFLIVEIVPYANVTKTTAVLKTVIPDIQIETATSFEIKYRIQESYSKQLPQLLKMLEENGKTLEIIRFGVSFTTLGDVFSQVLVSPSDQEDNKLQETGNLNMSIDGSEQLSEIFTEGSKKNSRGYSLYLYQFLAMLMKRAFLFRRSLFLFVLQITVIITLTAIAISIGREASNIRQPALSINLKAYKNATTAVTGQTNNIYYKSYRRAALKDSSHLKDWKDGDFSDNMLHETVKNMDLVRTNYIVGASFHSNNVTAWFNNIPLHSAPLSLSMIINAILEEEVDAQHHISFVQHPVDFGSRSKLDRIFHSKSVGYQLAFYYGFAMAFISSFFLIVYIYERQNKFKHLQFISGVKLSVYWLTSILWDAIIFAVMIVITIITLVCFQEDGYSTSDDFWRLSILLGCFAFSSLSTTYVLSFAFNSSASGFVWMSVLNLFTGVTSFMVVGILRDEIINLSDTADSLHKIFIIFPHYALPVAMADMHRIFSLRKVCYEMIMDCADRLSIDSSLSCSDLICNRASACCNLETDYWDWDEPGIGKILIYQVIVGGIFFIILCMIESNILSVFRRFKTSFVEIHRENITDDDVNQEKNNVNFILESNIENQYAVVLKDMSKTYKGNIAVNRLNLAVMPAECFGLLGQNGAGKTTLFKMMTGDISITYGNAWLEGNSVKEEIGKVRKSIGYCPQYDALLNELTGKEILIIFCLIKGIRLKNIKGSITKLAELFNFSEYLNKKSGKYSGGNRRKLSTAIAFTGNPSLVYLDEPSTGMDPASQRHIWKILHRLRASGTSIILTSHSMEECEALCTRLAIMIHGSFRCLGSIQHLKHKFMGGYILSIKVLEYKLEVVEQFVKENFKNANLKEKFVGFLRYHIQELTVPLWKMFSLLEERKQKTDIEDYSLGQAGLEQIFIYFVESTETQQ
ncbi:ATP-binding cassette sub-family A member 2 isoform X2 [Agrilus planipennis]|uniref:ATP-binding cassette sub-family A member 2 isoform X2 n=1 Tax=Agrilus planipennis TaxID=224129 RepID=A0A1W4X3K3_AGRPL|nr:ATP-binding cassette sub-family A member 2 isoform X2 [Agrilus planipennis]